MTKEEKIDAGVYKFAKAAINGMNELFHFLNKAKDNDIDITQGSVSIAISEIMEDLPFRGQVILTFIGDESKFLAPDEVRLQMGVTIMDDKEV